MAPFGRPEYRPACRKAKLLQPSTRECCTTRAGMWALILAAVASQSFAAWFTIHAVLLPSTELTGRWCPRQCGLPTVALTPMTMHPKR
eukprot:4201540-Prymnesium_polylepis.1